MRGIVVQAIIAVALVGGAKLPPQRIDAIFRRLATEGQSPSYSWRVLPAWNPPANIGQAVRTSF